MKDYTYENLRKMIEQNEQEESEEIFSNDFEDDIIGTFEDMEDNPEMSGATKFFNLQCINLYAYIDYAVATQMTTNVQLNQPIDHLINTPIELYESPYTAKIFAPKTGKKQLMVFAVDVQNSIYDEFDLMLEDKIRNDGRSSMEIRQSVHVVRQLKSYKVDKNKKAKPYISYIVNNQNAIKQVFPLQ